MDSYLLIIKYLFKKKGIDNIDNTIDEFFENGLSFPQFISIILDVDEIPKINKNPKTLFHKKMNNDVALQFLCQKNATIGKFNPNYNTERDKMNLLLLIFTKQCFNTNINEIITKCNLIVQSLNIKFEKKSDIISANCLLSLLNVLSDGKVQFNKDLDVNKNFDEIMVQSFSQANAPLVINKSSLDIQNQSIFLIQIEILFDYFSDKINKIDNAKNIPESKPIQQSQEKTPSQKIPESKPIQNSQEKTPSQKIPESKPIQQSQERTPNKIVPEPIAQANYETNYEASIENNQTDQKEIQNDQEEDEEEDITEEIEEDQEDINQEDYQFDEDDWKKIDERIKKKKKKKKYDDSDDSSYDDDDSISLQFKQEEALLKTLNVIGRGKFHFNNFHDSVKNNSIPRFVMFLLNLKSIKGVHIKSIKSNEKDQKITKEELNNINSVIRFLGTKEIRFKILKFDFKNRATEESSAVLFYTNLLNFFFIKTTKRDIYERVAILLCTKKKLFHFDDFRELRRDSTYVALLHFFNEKNFSFYFSDFPDKIDDLAPDFNKAKIPLVINNKILDIGYKAIMPDSIFYQLQLIFDAIDSGPKSLVVFEKLLKIIYNIKQLKVPKYNEIAGSILAKRTSIEFQNARSDQYLKRADSESLSKSLSSFENIQIEPIKDTIKVNTYRTRQQESKQSIQSSNIETNFQKSANANEIFDKLLKSNECNFKFENGVIYNKTKNQNQSQQDWIKEITNIKKITKKEEENKETLKMQRFHSSKNSFDSKLYKIFIYDETNKNWTFQSDVFQQFAADTHINIDDAKTPIVVILDSNKDDSISLISNLINGFHPRVDNEQDIFIYSLCNKTLSMLNFYIDFKNKRKSSIKPMFLLLHIPKAKESLPNIQNIVFEIYVFLSFVSDLEIVILNKNHYEDQIELIKSIKDTYKFFKGNNAKNNLSDSSFDDYTSLSSSSEEEEKADEEMEEDTWDEVNIIDNNNKFSKSENVPDIRVIKSEVLLLVNDSEIHSSREVKKNLKENKFFQNLKKQIEGDVKNKIRCINVKEPDSYEKFLDSFNNQLMRHFTKFSEVKTSFNDISLFKLQSSYASVRCNANSWKKSLKSMILDRHKDLKSDSSLPSGDPFILISQLSKELAQITPFFDIEFTNESKSILSDLNSAGTKLNRELYSNELAKSADSHLIFLIDKINEKFFWTEEQMDLLTKSHYSFLKDEFYDIIQLTSSNQNYSIVYEENYDILENQMKKSKNKIDNAFKPYVEKIKIKKNPQEQDIKEKIRKGANYCMKETENLREIKVAVQIKKDLRSEIEQDF